jgi:glycosyltransferase involved in cell wall biosynthesis
VEADVVIFHWWHHPAMAKFLHEIPNFPIRSILWVHVNGCNYPYLPSEFVEKFQKIFFTNGFSISNPLWSDSIREVISKKSSLVYGLGDSAINISKDRYSIKDTLYIGYIGTISLSKLHSEFIEYAERAINEIKNIKFIMVGDLEDAGDILREIELRGISNYFDFPGYSNKIEDYLEKFDIFSYLLNPNHYGTTENSILEAMRYGLPVILCNNSIEKNIIDENKNVAFLVNDVNNYIDTLKLLREDKNLRLKVGNNAKEFIKNKFSTNDNFRKFVIGINDVLAYKKELLNLKDVLGSTPSDWFLMASGKFKVDFENLLGSNCELSIINIKNNSILLGKNKSSIFHFANYFANDEKLRKWKEVLSGK